MSSFWSWFIIILTLANILGCFWLLWWTSKKRPGEVAEGANETGHTWDGDLSEYNNPLPRWWLNLFYITIFFSLGYLILYPGLGNFAGTLGWTSTGALQEDMERAEAELAPIFARYADMSIEDISRNEDAMRLAASVFANNCTTCHGSDARGALGFPNLTDGHWQWGGSPDQVLASILQGRHGVMPGWGSLLGERGVAETAVYVQKLAGQRVDETLAAAGQKHYQGVCASCHGPEGAGMTALGAPDLRHGVYVFGGSFEAISATIRDGRQNQMPPHEVIIGRDRARIVAAYVLSLNRDAKTD